MTTSRHTKTYRVYGAMRDTGENTSKLIEASTAEEAQHEANRLGLMVSGVEVHVDSSGLQIAPASPHRPVVIAIQSDSTASRPLDARAVEHEEVLWTGTPSQWCNAWVFVLATLFFWLIVPLLAAIYRWMTVKSMIMTVTTQRIRLEWGLLSKHFEEVELFRIRDSKVTRTVLDRWRGIGTVLLISTDPSTPTLRLPGIREPLKVRELLRAESLRARRAHGVKTLESS